MKKYTSSPPEINYHLQKHIQRRKIANRYPKNFKSYNMSNPEVNNVKRHTFQIIFW